MAWPNWMKEIAADMLSEYPNHRKAQNTMGWDLVQTHPDYSQLREDLAYRGWTQFMSSVRHLSKAANKNTRSEHAEPTEDAKIPCAGGTETTEEKEAV